MSAGSKLNPAAEEFRPPEKLKPPAQTSFSVPTSPRVPPYSHSMRPPCSPPPPPPPPPPVYIPLQYYNFPQDEYRILPPPPSTKRNVLVRYSVSDTLISKSAALEMDRRLVLTEEKEEKTAQRRGPPIRGRFLPSPAPDGKNNNGFQRGRIWSNSGRGGIRFPTAEGLREKPREQIGQRKWVRLSDHYPIGCECTTVMIRNIPNRLSRGELLELVDDYCREMNKAAVKGRSEIDFLYLPFDFSSGSNFGYAFLNFTTNLAAFEFCKSWTDLNWSELGYKSNKFCRITCAHIQGKEMLRKRFQKCLFQCETDEFLPLEFSPPRDGLCTAEVITVGSCLLGKASSAPTVKT